MNVGRCSQVKEMRASEALWSTVHGKQKQGMGGLGVELRKSARLAAVIVDDGINQGFREQEQEEVGLANI